VSGLVLGWEESAALVSRIIDRLDRMGHENTADLARLVRGARHRVGLQALAQGRWTAELREGGEDLLRVHGQGGFDRPLKIRDLEARALLRDPARRTAITTISAALHIRRWCAAAASLGVASEGPWDTVHRLRAVETPSDQTQRRNSPQTTRMTPLRAAPEIVGIEGDGSGEAFGLAAKLRAQKSPETAKWLLG